MITVCRTTEMSTVTHPPFFLSLPADSIRTSSNMTATSSGYCCAPSEMMPTTPRQVLSVALWPQRLRRRLLDGDRVPRRFEHQPFLQREILQRLVGERFLLVLLHLDVAGVERVARHTGAAGRFFALLFHHLVQAI